MASLANKILEINDLLASFRKLLKSGVYSDLTIECEEKHFKVHRAIVCPRSSVLSSMMNDSRQKTQIGLIELDEDSVEMIEKMIEFLYTLCYDDDRDSHGHNQDVRSGEELSRNDAQSHHGSQIMRISKGNMPRQGPTILNYSSPEPEPQRKKPSKRVPEKPAKVVEGPLLINTHLFMLGEFYDIPALRYYSRCQYAETVEKRWDSKFFFKSIDLVYDRCVTTRDMSLKEVMIRTARNNLEVLMKREGFVQLLRLYGDFSQAVLQNKAAESSQASKCDCRDLRKQVVIKNMFA